MSMMPPSLESEHFQVSRKRLHHDEPEGLPVRKMNQRRREIHGAHQLPNRFQPEVSGISRSFRLLQFPAEFGRIALPPRSMRR